MYLFYPHHLIKGDLLPDAYQLLTNQKFIACRLQDLGIENGTEQHMHDIESVLKVVLKNEKKQASVKLISITSRT